MGQTLSEPIVEKTSATGGDEHHIYGLSAMQGWRISMEDDHVALLDLNEFLGIDPTKSKKMSLFGVFDGHGGSKVATFASKNLPAIILDQEKFKAGDIEQALKDSFLATDSAILADPNHAEEVSGCTACIGLITDNKIYLANAGDSRSVLGINGRAKPLSQDHKPGLESEKSRITAAGGFVDFGRVNGNLALSRAIGDFEFKKSADLSPEAQIVTAYPDVEVHEIGQDVEFMIIACDGIWDCQSSQAAVEFVRRGIVAKQELDKVCENLMDNCLASNSDTGGVGCDNMTMIIVGFLQGRSKEQWYEDIAQRVAKGEGPCAPPEYAEFRGPGVHHSDHVDGDIGYGLDMMRKSQDSDGSSYRGRIIFLGDGSELLTNSDDVDMLDVSDEDLDLESQVPRVDISHGHGQSPPNASNTDSSAAAAIAVASTEIASTAVTNTAVANTADAPPVAADSTNVEESNHRNGGG